MAGEVEKLSGKLGIDTTDFKTALGAANRELRVLESGFKASAAALGDWAGSATGLETRIKSLTSQIDIQKLKVSALQAEHARLAAENGENSRAAQDAEIKLNKETETLNRMQGELNKSESALQEMKGGEDQAGTAAEDMGNKVEESGAKAEQSGNQFETFKSILGGVATVAKGLVVGILAVGTATIAAVSGMAALAVNTASTAEQIQDLSTQTGISTTRLQELKFAGEIVGTSLETITGANARLIRSMASASDETGKFNEKMAQAQESKFDNLEEGDVVLGDMASAFKELNVSVTDSSGKLRDNQAVFAEVIDALGKVENPAERDALAMKLFGKSAQELNPLIKAGSGELARLSAEAHTVGAVMSEEDVAAAGAFKDQLDTLKMGFQGVVAQIGLAFIPGLSAMATQGKGYLMDLVGVVLSADGDIGKMAGGFGEIIGKIVTDLASQLPQLMSVGVGILQAIITSLLSALPTLIPAAVSIIQTLISFIVQNVPMLLNAGIQMITALLQAVVQALPMLIGAGVQILMTLINALIQNLPMLITAGLQAIITLAQGLTQSLPTLIPAIVQALITIVQTLIENLPMLIDAALQLILALATGLVAAIPVLIPAIPVIIEALINAILTALPMILGVAAQLIGVLGSGLINNIPIILTAGADILIALGTALATFITDTIPQIGKSIVEGLSNGINSATGTFLDNIAKFIIKVIDAAKKGFEKIVDVGKGIVEGVWKGIQQNADWFYNQVKSFFTNMIQEIKDALLQKSPSKKGIEIGQNFGESIGLGLFPALADVQSQLRIVMRGFPVTAMQGVMNEFNNTTQNENFQFYAPVIIQGETPAESLGATLKMKRF